MMTRRLQVRWVVLGCATALSIVAACSGSNADDDRSASVSCGATLPRTCTTAPSYAATVQPLIERTCAGCHNPTGVAASRDLTTYKDIASLETTELIDLYSCQMPPLDAGAGAMLSLADRETIMQWFVCGSPDDSPDAAAEGSSDASPDR